MICFAPGRRGIGRGRWRPGGQASCWRQGRWTWRRGIGTSWDSSQSRPRWPATSPPGWGSSSTSRWRPPRRWPETRADSALSLQVKLWLLSWSNHNWMLDFLFNVFLTGLQIWICVNRFIIFLSPMSSFVPKTSPLRTSGSGCRLDVPTAPTSWSPTWSTSKLCYCAAMHNCSLVTII